MNSGQKTNWGQAYTLDSPLMFIEKNLSRV
jgi:hypothetical protein